MVTLPFTKHTDFEKDILKVIDTHNLSFNELKDSFEKLIKEFNFYLYGLTTDDLKDIWIKLHIEKYPDYSDKLKSMSFLDFFAICQSID